jgi:hypothetical protein
MQAKVHRVERRLGLIVDEVVGAEVVDGEKPRVHKVGESVVGVEQSTARPVVDPVKPEILREKLPVQLHDVRPVLDKAQVEDRLVGAGSLREAVFRFFGRFSHIFRSSTHTDAPIAHKSKPERRLFRRHGAGAGQAAEDGGRGV